MTSPYFRTAAKRTTSSDSNKAGAGHKSRRVAVQYEEDALAKLQSAEELASNAEKSRHSRKAAAANEEKPQVSNVKNANGWMPQNWEQQFKNIEEMRKATLAPVDTMGCERIADASVDPATYRYQVLLGLMLSSQTKDEVTSAAMQRLREYGCTMERMLCIPDEKLLALIRPVGFCNTKVKFIKRTTDLLVTKFNHDIPRTVEDLCSLPGVGPKMAHLTMKSAWNEMTGIGVDTHVHRIVNRLKWVPKETKTPEATRVALESWLPKSHWWTVNALLVGFGQTICRPVRPKCKDCLNRKICPASSAKK